MGEIINVIDLAKKIKGQIIEFVSQRENNGKMILNKKKTSNNSMSKTTILFHKIV